MSPPRKRLLTSASLEPEDVEFLETLPGTLSQRVRLAVTHGCAALRGETLPPRQVSELRQIFETMEAIWRSQKPSSNNSTPEVAR